MDNLSEKTLGNIGFSLARLQRMLGGLAGLLRCVNDDEDTLEQEELQGISEILEMLQKESLKASRSLLGQALHRRFEGVCLSGGH